MKKLVVGIDATNIRGGGGRTHLMELLRAADPETCRLQRVIVWGGRETLDVLDEKPWLMKINTPELNGGLIQRTLWQCFSLAKAARAKECDVLFVPGGSYAGDFRPVVTMSQNLLPFEWRELRRYGCTPFTLKRLALRFSQSRTFCRADGVIFLTRYAKQCVVKTTGGLKGRYALIPHGIGDRFFIEPRAQQPIEAYTKDNPYRILYVSIIDQYKHQWHVVEAIADLRNQTRWPLMLELVGPAYPPALRRLTESLHRYDPEKDWVRYHGAVPYAELHRIYSQADLGVFASSCENMPNILLENMAAGLPIACSNRGPMPEILGEAGVYFDPESPKDIAKVTKQLIDSPEFRTQKAKMAFDQARSYSWKRCAEETFAFLARVVNGFEKKNRTI